MSDEDLPTNNWVWVPDDEELFVRGNITSYLENGMLRVAVKTGVHDFSREVPQKDVENCNPAKFNKCADMAELTHLNEPSVIYNMFLRYNDDRIYTYSGLFLVAINPYKSLPIYDQATLEQFHAARRDERLPPHIFAIAENTHRNLVVHSRDQSILVTGESGAGKTENTKKVIQYLSLISTAAAEHDDIHDKIVQANPILESFGNAKTVKNNNSSRFGKFIKIFFDLQGLICGATIDYYLLEKSRVSHQLKDERNYHAFYQLLKGCASDVLRHKYHLDADFLQHKYLNLSSGTIPNVDDAADFRLLEDSFRIMGFPQSDVDSIFLGLAIILHLGNVDFTSWKADQANFADSAHIGVIARLLGVSENELTVNLLRPKVRAGRELVQTQKRPAEVKRIIDAFAKHLYEKIFQFIIAKINASLRGSDHAKVHFIGVLDIAGFEIFDINSFEQLCINYTNEKLQQFFNHHSFILEQSEYLREDIHWEYIDFGLDLQPTIDLIESKQPMGILEILNDQCIMPNASEELFIDKLLKTWGNGESKNFRPNKVRNGFIVDHYAGLVEYNVDDWLQKNTDPISESLLLLMGASSLPFIRDMFVSLDANGKSCKFKTVTQRYKEQLSHLMKELCSTEPHFVRCILPNLDKKPNKFDKRLVLNQLRCNGVLEGIRIARAGFPNKMSYEEFFLRYSILNGVDTFTKNLKSNSELILKLIKLDTESYRIGITKIFFKNGILGHLEELRDASLKSVFTSFQSLVRGKQVRTKIQREIVVAQASRVIGRNMQRLDALVYQKQSPWLLLFINLKPMLEDSVKVLATTEINESVKQLNSKLKEAENAKASADSENCSLKERLCVLEDEIMSVNKAASEKSALLRLLENEEKSRELRLSDTVRQLAELKAASEKLSGSKAVLQTQFDQSLARIAELETQLTKAEADARKGHEQIEQLKKEVLRAAAESKRLSGNEVQLKKELAKTTGLALLHAIFSAKVQELEATCASSRAELASKNKRIAELDRSVDELQQTITGLRQNSKDAVKNTQALEEVELKLRIVSKSLADQTEEVKLLKLRISQLEAENNSLEQSKKRIMQECENNKAAMMNKKRELDVLDAKFETLHSQKLALERQLNSVSAQLREQFDVNEGQKAHINELNEALGANKNLQAALEREKAASAEQADVLQSDRAMLSAHVAENKTTLRRLEELKNECQYLEKSKSEFSEQVLKLKAANESLELRLRDKENIPPAAPANDPALVADCAAMKTKFNEQSALLRNEKFENQKLAEEVEMLREKVRDTFESPLKRGVARRSLQGEDSMRSSQGDARLAEEIKNLRVRLQQEEANVVRAEDYAIELQKKLNKYQATHDTQGSADYLEKLRASQLRVEQLESKLSALSCESKESSPDPNKVSMSRGSSYGAISNVSGAEFGKIYSNINQTLKSTREELAKSKSEILRLKSLLRESEDELHEYKRDNVKKSVRDYEDKLARINLKNNTLVQQVNELKKSLASHKRKHDDSREKVERAEAAAAASKRLETQYKEELQANTLELRLKKEELRAIDLVVRQLREDRAELEAKLKDLEVGKSKLRESNKNLKDQMAYLNNSYGDRKRTVEDHKEEIRALQEDVKFKMVKETEIIKESKKLKIENEELLRANEEVMAVNHEVTEKNEMLNTQNDNYRNEIEQLTQAQQSHKRKLEQNARQIESLHKIIEENGRQMEAINSFNRELESLKAQHETRISNLEDLLKTATENLEIAREHAQNMEHDCQAALAELKDTKSQWDTSEHRYKDARKDNLVLEEENVSLKTINDELGGKVSALEEKLYSNEQLKFLEKSKDDLKAQIDLLKNENLEHDVEEQRQKRKVAALEYELENKSAQLKRYNDESFSLQNTVTQQKGQIEYLFQENSDKDLKIRAQERELAELREKLAEAAPSETLTKENV